MQDKKTLPDVEPSNLGGCFGISLGGCIGILVLIALVAILFALIGRLV